MTEPDPSSESNEISESFQSSSSELVNIDSKISPEAAVLEKDEGITPEQKRKNFDNKIAGILGLSLWGILGVVIIVHLSSVVWLNILVDKPQEEIELRTSNINDSAKTIYTFLGTLVTAVSGYYFTTLTRSNNSDDN